MNKFILKIDLYSVSENKINTFEIGSNLDNRVMVESEFNYHFNSIRIVCIVFTEPKNDEKKTTAITLTWGRRCNRLLFFRKCGRDSEDNNKCTYMSVALKQVYQSDSEAGDWFLVANDNSFFIMENLRHFLLEQNSLNPLQFGFKLKPYVKQGYMNSVAGFVLSNEALRRLASKSETKACKKHSTLSEDIAIGICLQSLKVEIVDSRDENGRERFLPFTPRHHLTNAKLETFWFWKYAFYPQQKVSLRLPINEQILNVHFSFNEGFKCCSDTAISFNKLTDKQIYAMNYLLYNIKISSH
ncbi:C1GalTA-like protein [Leptotrombidium deliense]|uniref:N-acetylgalactosaminide beta-1,3-galactosyltransferase n=1 Tax=Leptotrombidium deliense TaxID=299467 RepID=A0A443SC08_9ACAR|nr:C1GalTA-like protein [Leptotrombidium deliense]